MSYTNDSKPSGSYTDDSGIAILGALYGSAKYGFSKYGVTTYSGDSKPSGSYSNDVKPT